MKKFKMSIWDPARGNQKMIVWADSYDHAVSLYASRFPPSVIWSIEQIIIWPVDQMRQSESDLRQSESIKLAV